MHTITIDAPSTLGVTTKGIELAPAAFRKAGLLERLDARQGKTIHIPPYNAVRDPETLLLNPKGMRDVALNLADAVGAAFEEGLFPLVLGGDCSILLENLLALRRQGPCGLFFLDGHEDFYTPKASPNGEGADMDLALVTGRGPDILANIGGLRPLVKDEHVVAFGFRDEAKARSHGSPAIPPTILSFSVPYIRELGIRAAAEKALRHLEETPGMFWIHFDVDVLDNDRMPAADNDVPGGLSFDEAAEALRIMIASGKVAGMDVTVFNPTLDADGSCARAVVDIIAGAFGK